MSSRNEILSHLAWIIYLLSLSSIANGMLTAAILLALPGFYLVGTDDLIKGIYLFISALIGVVALGLFVTFRLEIENHDELHSTGFMDACLTAMVAAIFNLLISFVLFIR